MRKVLQHALTQEASMRHDQVQQALRQQICQEEHADDEPTRQMTQLRQLIAEQAEAMRRYEAHSQQFVSQQQEYAHKQHAQFQQFDSALKDKDTVNQSLKQELANNKEHHLQELEQAWMASIPSRMRRRLRRRPYLLKATLQDFLLALQRGTLILGPEIKRVSQATASQRNCDH